MSASDADAGDQLRIFVADTESVFFNVSLNSLVPQSGCGNGLVQPFRASRSGANSAETVDYVLNGPYLSIIAGFLPSVAFLPSPALQNIFYTLGPGTGYQPPPNLRVNRDVVICARAFDMSRLRYGRWVGLRRFNFSEPRYGYGDYDSSEHCWRIVPQAPPVMLAVTVSSNATGKDYAPGANGTFTVPGGTGDILQINFTAVDANALDTTEVRLLSRLAIPLLVAPALSPSREGRVFSPVQSNCISF